jgi:hypothetical protein
VQLDSGQGSYFAHSLTSPLTCCFLSLQISVLEAEVSDLEKELSLRDEMEAALKETLRELERAAARQQTAGHQVRVVLCVLGKG